MGGRNINALFDKYAERLICMDFIDAKYEFQRQEMRLANGKSGEARKPEMERFKLSNRDLGEGRDRLSTSDAPIETSELQRLDHRRRSLCPARTARGFFEHNAIHSGKS